MSFPGWSSSNVLSVSALLKRSPSVLKRNQKNVSSTARFSKPNRSALIQNMRSDCHRASNWTR